MESADVIASSAEYPIEEESAERHIFGVICPPFSAARTEIYSPVLRTKSGTNRSAQESTSPAAGSVFPNSQTYLSDDMNLAETIPHSTAAESIIPKEKPYISASSVNAVFPTKNSTVTPL